MNYPTCPHCQTQLSQMDQSCPECAALDIFASEAEPVRSPPPAPSQKVPEFCSICLFEDRGLAPCLKCGSWVCVYCSGVGIKVDRDGSNLVEVCPDFWAILCSQCNPPQGGTRSRLRLPSPPPPTFGKVYYENQLLEVVS